MSGDRDKDVRRALLTAKAQRAPATLSAYQPTLRDKAQAWVADHIPFGDNYLRQNLSHTLTDHPLSPLNWSPVGAAFMADEGGRQMASGHPLAGAANVALAAVPVPAVVKGAKGLIGGMAHGAERVAEQTAERAAPQIVAYHGSPHKFDAFDTAKIGTGEGAQVYGHGLYFAENPEVAAGYRQRLAGGQSLPEDVRAEYFTPGRIVPGYGGPDKVVGYRPGSDGEPWNWSVDVVRSKPDGTPIPGERVRNHSTEPDARAVEAALGRKLPEPGATYQVGINAHPDHFLDWDKPLSEQHPKVQEAINASPIADRHIGPNTKASVIYTLAGHGEGGVDASRASQTLQDAGIPGIKYLDAGSRSAGDGTRNYVVFDPKHIDILKRYGIAATALGGGALGAAGSQKPQQQPKQPDPAQPQVFNQGGKVERRALITARHLHAVDHNPTDAQKEAGNYRKEHISFQGLPITIENKKGSERSGVDANGKRWSCVLPADYGYFKRSEGADGDQVDCYVGPNPASRLVVIVNQNDLKTGRFDEHKAVLGCDSERQAVDLYCRAFSDGKGAARIGSVETMSIDALKHWLNTGKTQTRASARSIIDKALAVSRQAAA